MDDMTRKNPEPWMLFVTLFLAIILFSSVGLILLSPRASVYGSDRDYLPDDSDDVITTTLRLYTGNDPATWEDSLPVHADSHTIDLVNALKRDAAAFEFGESPEQTVDAMLSYASDPILLYSTSLGGENQDEGWSIAVDKDGNTYVSGITRSPDLADLSDYAGEKDIFAAKFDRSGSLVYITIIGGQASEEGNAIAVDDFGNAYIAGQTFSQDFPILNAWQPAFIGYEEAFLLKLDANGQLTYATFIGGTGPEEVNDMVADSVGNVYLGGEVYSDDFPLMDPWSAAVFGPQEEDGFITIFNAEGDMVYSTLISAPNRDQVFRIAVDADGYVYGTGMTSSPSFPTVNAFQSVYGGGWDDCLVFKLDPWNNEMIYATLLGGSDRDECWGLAVDNEGAAYVTGHTLSENFPLARELQSTLRGSDDVFIAKISPTGKQLLFSSYLGGTQRDRAWDLDLDSGGNVYITGETASLDFPTASALQAHYSGEMDAFLVALDPAHTLQYASYIGGSQYDRGYRLTVDGDWVAHVTGGTASANFPTTINTTSYGGGTDAFVAAYGLIPTPTPAPTPTPYASAEIGPDGGVVWMSYPEHVTLLTVPAGAIIDPAVFTLTYESRSSRQGDLTGMNHFFTLDSSVSPTRPETPFRLPDGLLLTMGFDSGPVVEDTVTLYRLSAGAWTTDAITVVTQQPQYLQAGIAWTGIYGLMGESNRVYLPAVLKQ
jgi:hypothetical protein